MTLFIASRVFSFLEFFFFFFSSAVSDSSKYVTWGTLITVGQKR